MLGGEEPLPSAWKGSRKGKLPLPPTANLDQVASCAWWPGVCCGSVSHPLEKGWWWEEVVGWRKGGPLRITSSEKTDLDVPSAGLFLLPCRVGVLS